MKMTPDCFPSFEDCFPDVLEATPQLFFCASPHNVAPARVCRFRQPLSSALRQVEARARPASLNACSDRWENQAMKWQIGGDLAAGDPLAPAPPGTKNVTPISPTCALGRRQCVVDGGLPGPLSKPRTPRNLLN